MLSKYLKYSVLNPYPQWSNIHIASDRTSMQQNHMTKLKEEL